MDLLKFMMVLVLFTSKRYDASYDRIKYLASKKSGITDTIGHKFLGVRIDSYNFLPIQ